MGRVFVLGGASGVGKTTFLQELFSRQPKPNGLRLIPRYTNRPRRSSESSGFEYQFTSYQGLLQKTFANDFVYLERWGDYYSGIESHEIEATLLSNEDAVVLASVPGAERLQERYGNTIVPLYLWPGSEASLRNPSCLEPEYEHVQEIKRRIRKKLIADGFSEFERESLSNDDFLDKRMIDNYLDIAAANGRLRSEQRIVIITDPAEHPDLAVRSFLRLRETEPMPLPQSLATAGSECFVLMPFLDEMRPVFEDHIVPACESRGLQVTRADQIFSSRPVMDDVLHAVRSAHFIIADLTDSNPNVFYEVGVCHALGKEVILITQNNDAPFDLRHLRRIKYDYTPRGAKELEDKIGRTIDAAVRESLP
jgi:guanylate kinase